MAKIKNLKDFLSWVREENQNYLKGLRKEGGIGLRLRRITAQLLWLFSGYSLGIWLLPIKNFLQANAILLIFFGLVALLWSKIKLQLPSWIGSLIKGEFFYRSEGIFLNMSIFLLILFNTFLLLIPIDFYKKIIKTKNE
jgi:hypothetical protein